MRAWAWSLQTAALLLWAGLWGPLGKCRACVESCDPTNLVASATICQRKHLAWATAGLQRGRFPFDKIEGDRCLQHESEAWRLDARVKCEAESTDSANAKYSNTQTKEYIACCVDEDSGHCVAPRGSSRCYCKVLVSPAAGMEASCRPHSCRPLHVSWGAYLGNENIEAYRPLNPPQDAAAVNCGCCGYWDSERAAQLSCLRLCPKTSALAPWAFVSLLTASLIATHLAKKRRWLILLVCVAMSMFACWGLFRGGRFMDAPHQAPWTQSRIKYTGSAVHGLMLLWILLFPRVQKRAARWSQDRELEEKARPEGTRVGKKLTLPEPFVHIPGTMSPGVSPKSVGFLPIEAPRPLTLAGPPTTPAPGLPAGLTLPPTRPSPGLMSPMAGMNPLERSYNSAAGGALSATLRTPDPRFSPAEPFQRSLNSTQGSIMAAQLQAAYGGLQGAPTPLPSVLAPPGGVTAPAALPPVSMAPVLTTPGTRAAEQLRRDTPEAQHAGAETDLGPAPAPLDVPPEMRLPEPLERPGSRAMSLPAPPGARPGTGADSRSAGRPPSDRESRAPGVGAAPGALPPLPSLPGLPKLPDIPQMPDLRPGSRAGPPAEAPPPAARPPPAPSREPREHKPRREEDPALAALGRSLGLPEKPKAEPRREDARPAVPSADSGAAGLPDLPPPAPSKFRVKDPDPFGDLLEDTDR